MTYRGPNMEPPEKSCGRCEDSDDMDHADCADLDAQDREDALLERGWVS